MHRDSGRLTHSLPVRTRWSTKSRMIHCLLAKATERMLSVGVGERKSSDKKLHFISLERLFQISFAFSLREYFKEYEQVFFR